MKKVMTAFAVAAFALSGPALISSAYAKKPDKISPALKYVQKKEMNKARGVVSRSPADQLFLGAVNDGYITLNVTAAGSTSRLESAMKSLGSRNVTSYGRIVSGQVPADKLSQLAASPEVKFARPVIAVTNVGLVTTQGDRSMRTNQVRANTGFDGTDMMVGVLSDSFACRTTPLNAQGVFTTPAQDVANGDLPPNVLILSDITSGCIDEGRGMAQLIHDVVPGAKLAFHTAFNGQADFAQGIIDLALAGSDVIVDDVIYLDEPMFQDGIIAQAADEVARLGVPYFSSNGNRARDSYQSDFRAVNASPGGIAGTWHDFDPGAGVDVLKTIALTSAGGLAQINLSFQWDEPNFSVSGAPGSASDVDVIMFDMAGNPVAECFDDDGNFIPPANGLCQFFFTDSEGNIDGGVGGDAIDLLSLVSFIPGTVQVQLGFHVQSGPAPTLTKYVRFPASGAFTEIEYNTNSPSGFGHNNAANAEGVGASAFNFTEEFIGDPQTNNFAGAHCVPACLNDFSSAGGTPIVFDIEGNRLATPQVRLKPGITGPDGGNTTFFTTDSVRDDDDGDGNFAAADPGEFPNFFGTSAAAPHVASVATLLLDSEGSQILEVKKNGQVKYNLCKLKKNKPGRANGTDVTVAPPAVNAQLNGGAVLGPCDRTEPAAIYQVMRDNAQNMTKRVNTNTGVTIQVFTEVGPAGFDFDSGFGFIDAVAAMNDFQN